MKGNVLMPPKVDQGNGALKPSVKERKLPAFQNYLERETDGLRPLEQELQF